MFSQKKYFCTTFHEQVHSSGYVSRLDRSKLCNINFFGDHSYQGELVAEIGADFLWCHEAGILNVTMANSEAYIAGGWRQALGNDPKMIMEMSGKARKAVGLIRGMDEKPM